MLSPAALLARLDAAVRSTSGVDRPQRHRTLHDTIAWSHDLLSPELQTVFRRLGAFAGPVDLDAVRAVCTPDADPLDPVAELVDASLIQVADGVDNEPYVDLLQTVRAFARDCLVESGELDATRERHARHFLELAERLSPQLHSPLQVTAAEHLSAVDDDLNRAMDWALRPGGAAPPPSQVTVGLRMVAALWWYWTANGQLSERRRWCERAIEVAPDGDSTEKAATLHALELQNSWNVDPDAGLPKTRIEESLAMYERLGDLGGMSDVANTLAQLCAHLGETARAYELYESAISWALEAGDDVRRASAMHYFADLLYDGGEIGRAVTMVEQARDLAIELGDERDALHREKWLAMILLEQDPAEAQARLYRLLPGVQRARQPALSISTVGTFADFFLVLGDGEAAARLEAAFETLGIAFGWPEANVRPAGAEKAMFLALRDATGDAAWDRAEDEGRTWTAQQALTYIAERVPVVLQGESAQEVAHRARLLGT
jgi:tetratricopeptide (TPR) repeat protein